MSDDSDDSDEEKRPEPLAAVRASRDISQFRLAVAADVSQSTIVNIEHYRQIPSVQVARRIADALGVSVYDIEWPDEATLVKRSKNGAVAA